MKFECCALGDGPDWLLAVVHGMSKESPGRLRSLAMDVVRSLLDTKVITATATPTTMTTTTTDLLKGTIAALEYLFSNATKYCTDAETFSLELQQLGLPTEHASILSSTWEAKRTELQYHFATKTIRIGEDFKALKLGNDAASTTDKMMAALRVPVDLVTVPVGSNGKERTISFHADLSQLQDLQQGMYM